MHASSALKLPKTPTRLPEDPDIKSTIHGLRLHRGEAYAATREALTDIPLFWQEATRLNVANRHC
jgi:hypothetical protein